MLNNEVGPPLTVPFFPSILRSSWISVKTRKKSLMKFIPFSFSEWREKVESAGAYFHFLGKGTPLTFWVST